jgi:hypothetical protein
LEVEGNGKLGAGYVNECKEFAEHILGKIKNMSKRTSGKKTNQQYSPISMAMTLWLKDKKVYKEFQEGDYYMLPTNSYLKKIKYAFQSRDGKDPKI